jgi:hypothetical protein
MKQAFDQRAACVKALDVIETESREQMTPRRGHHPMRLSDAQLILILLPGDYWDTEYRCLPDIIDPRGARGTRCETSCGVDAGSTRG